MKKLLAPLTNYYKEFSPHDREYVQYFALLVVVALMTAVLTPIAVALVALVQAQLS